MSSFLDRFENFDTHNKVIRDALLITDPNRPLYSLDVETTGSGRKSKIWSLGFGTGEGGIENEFYIKNILPEDPNKTIQDRLFEEHRKNNAGDFGKSQLDSGAFKPYEEGILKGEGVTLTEAVTQMNNTMINKPGILLIQNANFENDRFFEATQRQLNDSSSLSKIAAQQLYGDVLGRGILEDERNIVNVSDEVLEARRKFNQSLSSYKENYYSEGMHSQYYDQVLEAKNNLRGIINNEIRRKLSEGQSAVVDLMDIISMFHVDLADKGLIEGKHIGYLKSMEVLSQTMLGLKERHISIHDVNMQISVFNKIQQATLDLQAGRSLDSGIVNYIEALDKNAKNAYDLTLIKQLKSRLEEKTKYLTTGKDISTEVFDTDVVGKTIDYYLHAPETNIDRDELAENVRNAFRDAEEGKKASSVVDLLNEYERKIPQLNGDTLFTPTNKLDLAKSLGADSKLAIGLGAVAALGLISTITDRDKPAPKPTTYNELYNDVQLGTAYADWKERNNAYRSIY